MFYQRLNLKLYPFIFFSISLESLRPKNYGMNHLQSGFDEGNTDILITRDGDQVKMADNGSGFEVEVAPAAEHHDWLSETGLTEETPLFSGSDKRSESNRGAVPKDKLRRVWLVFYMLGMTTLLPWNFFIAVNDYWNFKFRDTEHNATHTELQNIYDHVMFLVNLSFHFVFLVGCPAALC